MVALHRPVVDAVDEELAPLRRGFVDEPAEAVADGFLRGGAGAESDGDRVAPGRLFGKSDLPAAMRKDVLEVGKVGVELAKGVELGGGSITDRGIHCHADFVKFGSEFP